MFLRRRSDAPISRGQAMVEFALVLPILALLLVMAVDFGRVFFGWVALQNAARIGADRASQSASAWPVADGEEVDWRMEYQALITYDLEAVNCTYPTPHPDPTFTNVNAGAADDDGDQDFGDLATVRLTCSFDLLTPLAEGILGGPITLSAESTFAINGMVIAGIPDPPPPPPEPCADPVADFNTEPPATGAGGNRVDGTTSPFTVIFTSTTPSSADCPISEYRWEVDGTPVGTNSPVLTHDDFTDAPGGGGTNYTVSLTVVGHEGATDAEDIGVRVTVP